LVTRWEMCALSVPQYDERRREEWQLFTRWHIVFVLRKREASDESKEQTIDGTITNAELFGL
jgi:hypothetical protein